MTRKFKICMIFSTSAVCLVLVRMINSAVNINFNASSWLFSFIVQLVCNLGLVVALYAILFKKNPLKDLSITTNVNPLIIILAIPLGIFFYLLTIGVASVWQGGLSILGYTFPVTVDTIYSGPEVLAMEIITVAILPAIGEEIVYRGMGRLVFDDSNDIFAIVAMALLFSLGHQYIVQTGYTFVGGLIFAFIAVKTKNIIPGMVVHCINNLIVVLIGYGNQTGDKFCSAINTLVNSAFSTVGRLLAVTFLSGLIVVGILVLMQVIQKQTKKKKQAKGEDNITTDGVVFFKNSSSYVDDIFGGGMMTNTPSALEFEGKKSKWYEYAFVYMMAALTVVTTIFTYIWGVWR